MSVILNPYLSFIDNAREAMDFYQTVFGGKLDRSTFGEYQMSEDPSEHDKVMHSQLTTDIGLVLMGADTPNVMQLSERQNGTVSLSGDDDEALRGYWDKLSDGGKVGMPLEKSPWGDSFGQLTDRFGVDWMVNIAGSAAS